MSDELKPLPCPFCGGEAEIRKLGMFESTKARCTSAECFIQRRTWAIDLRKWNSRPLEDALSKENANLKARVEAAEELIEAMRELLDARGNEHAAAIAEDNYYSGGTISTGERLKLARERALKANNNATECYAKWEALK